MAAGRHRTFDKEDALVKAMEIFWRKGYSGTSLSDLTDAMGINKPSLYAAFGNKEELFASAIQQYVNLYGVPNFEKLSHPEGSFKQRMQNYLEANAKMITDSKLPGGCFVTNSTSEASSDCLPENAVRTITEINTVSIHAFTAFFKDEQTQGNLDSAVSPEVLADYLLSLQFGLAVMARNGTKRDRLKKVINYALSSF